MKTSEKNTFSVEEQEIDTSLVVCEDHDADGVHWGLSFGGNNPTAEDYFELKDKETAFRLKDKLSAKLGERTAVIYTERTDWSVNYGHGSDSALTEEGKRHVNDGKTASIPENKEKQGSNWTGPLTS